MMPLQVVPSQLLRLSGIVSLYMVPHTCMGILLVKPNREDTTYVLSMHASECLANSGLNITSEGEKGAVLGLHHCAENYIREMVNELLSQVT